MEGIVLTEFFFFFLLLLFFYLLMIDSCSCIVCILGEGFCNGGLFFRDLVDFFFNYLKYNFLGVHILAFCPNIKINI